MVARVGFFLDPSARCLSRSVSGQGNQSSTSFARLCVSRAGKSNGHNGTFPQPRNEADPHPDCGRVCTCYEPHHDQDANKHRFCLWNPKSNPPPSPTGRYQPYLPYLPDAPDPAVVDKRVSQSTPTTRPPTLPTYSTVRSTLHRLLFDLETTNRNPYHVVVPTSLGESQTLTRSFRHRGVPNHTLQRQGNP